MDIFTTQLRQVLQTPIKPINLKVKALVKEPDTKVLSDDIDHNENHDQYFKKNKENKNQHQTSEQQKLDEKTLLEDDDKNSQSDNVNDGKHLDIYI